MKKTKKSAPAEAPSCIECGAPATWVRCTQFAGDHPLCDKHVAGWHHAWGWYHVWKRVPGKPTAWKDALDNSLAARALRGGAPLIPTERVTEFFALSDTERRRAARFGEKHRPSKGQRHELNPKTRRRTVHLEYRFQVTAIGTVITLCCVDCGAKTDITDYAEW